MNYVVKPTANKKYVRAILSQLPEGFKIGMIEEESDGTHPARPVNRNHPCVLAPDGTLLRCENGRPVMVCNTPGNRRSIKNDLREIERAYSLKEGVK